MTEDKQALRRKLLIMHREMIDNGTCSDKLASLIIMCSFCNLPRPSLLVDGDTYVKVYGEADYRLKLEEELLGMLREHLHDPDFGKKGL